jgi:putative phage-type endonuclease
MPEFLCDARNYRWLDERREGVTATDIVTILGMSSYDSPFTLYWRKVNEICEVPDNDRFRLGRALESYAVDRWRDEHTGLSLMTSGLWRSTLRRWQLATPDRLVYANLNLTGVLEVKTWADANRDAWEDGPPPAVYAQVLWQMDVMDVRTGYVGVLFLPSGRFQSYVIDHDKEDPIGLNCPVCDDQGIMRVSGLDFFKRMTGELPPPDADASAATLAAVKAMSPMREHQEAEVSAQLYEAWIGAKDEAAHWKSLARECEIHLREQLGEADTMTINGVAVGRRIITSSLVKEHKRNSDYLKSIEPKEDTADDK